MEKWSGRVDLNHRPPGPEPGALARLRYAPKVIPTAKSLSRITFYRNLPRFLECYYIDLTLIISSTAIACDLLAIRGDGLSALR